MATYNKLDDAYEWLLDLPPEAVVALLQYVCVDEHAPKAGRNYLLHTLFGPKGWAISFKGREFHLTPLSQGNMHYLFGYEHGTILANKLGSCIRLENRPATFDRRTIKYLLAVPAILASILGTMFVVMSLPPSRYWLGFLAVSALAAWFAFAFRWLVPAAGRESVGFLDEVFVNHCLHNDKPRNASKPARPAS